MIYNRNPFDASEGRQSNLSAWGQMLARVQLQGPITVLPHNGLPFPGVYGPNIRILTLRAPLPYITSKTPGPIGLKYQVDNE